jgi:hypothetical protein
LAATALALPGLAPARAQGADDASFSFQYGRYQEGERDLFGVHSDFDPVEADNLDLLGRITLFDRVKLALHWVQDTWSGATPISTAPQVLEGNRPTNPDGVSGATPFVQGDVFLNGDFEPLEVDDFGNVQRTNTQLVHTLSSASPETRNQLDLDLGYEWDAAELRIGGGFSLEPDYESRFARLGGSFDFDQKRTRVGFQLQLGESDTRALLDRDAVPYIDTSYYDGQIETFPSTGRRRLEDDRQDFGAQLGVTQILSRDTWLEARLGYTRSTGYLANPYKVVQVGFIDPEQQFLAPPGGYYAQMRALLEQRPDERNQWTFDLRLGHYVAPVEAALQLSWRLFHDDWGIDAHTLEASWAQPLGRRLSVTPRLRYYTQGAADFYTPWLLSQQAYLSIVTDPDTGDILSITPFDRGLLPSEFSSDHRLSGFGALSGGVSLGLRLVRGMRLDAGFEYYAHRGRFRLGGGGEGDFADFDSWLVSASLTLDAAALGALASADAQESHAGHVAHATGAPAGVMGAHMLSGSGDLMVGVRTQWSRQDGDMLHGTGAARDAEILARGCGEAQCVNSPERMDMWMTMLDLMVAPTDWLNLMLMPSFVNMEMELRPLAGATPDVHGTHDHSTGGVGDLGMFALLRLLEARGQRLHLTLGLSAPTGSVDEKLRRTHQQSRGYTHYGMQLGSGTWDFLPSLTLDGGWSAFSWGGQVSGIVRLEHENDSGYALGDVFQATAWGGFALTRWLSASARALYTLQGRIRGEYDRPHDVSTPMDLPGNYGGQFVDIGVGVAAGVPSGFLAGNRLSVEWLQPVLDDVNGYQLERTGALIAAWSVEF